MSKAPFCVLFFLSLLVSFTAFSQRRPDVVFAFVTDTHVSEGSRSVEDLRKCIKDINSNDSLEFVIFGGDLTDFGADNEIAMVKAMLDSLTVKYYVVQGNHDANWSESGCNTFVKTFGYEHFDFSKGGWRFLGCNSGPDMRMSPALIPRESMLWLKGLERREKAVFINHYTVDSTMLNWFDALREMKRLDTRFVIGGHFHKNMVRDYSGLPGVTCRSSMSTPGNAAAGYSIVRLYPDRVKISEKRVYGNSSAEMPPWYTHELRHVKDTVTYDSDSLPSDYPWMRYSVNEKYPCVTEVWKFQDDANIVAGFAKDSKKAYYTTASGYVRAIRLSDGKPVWSKQFPGKIFSTPAVSSGTLVFGCTDGGIYALDAKTGKKKWSRFASKSIVASPVIYKGKVFIGSSDGVFRCLDLSTGKTVWQYEGVKGHVASKPFVDDEQVVFGSWGRRLYSLDPKTGKLQWLWQSHKGSRMYSPASCVPVKSKGRIFFVVPDRTVYAVDARTGDELFHVKGGRDAMTLSEGGESVFSKTMFSSVLSIPAGIAPGGRRSVSETGKDPFVDEIPPLTSPEIPSSSLNWTADDKTGYELSPSALSEKAGVLLIPTDKGNVMALSSSDGHFLWAHKISVALVNPLTVWKEKNNLLILASSMDGTVSLLNYKY